jgi:arylformamidase
MQAHPGRLSVVYDERSGERLDLYGIAPGRPVFLWVHGGYRRGGSRLDNAFAAGGLCARRGRGGDGLHPGAGRAHRRDRAPGAPRWPGWRARPGPGLRGERIHVGGSSAGGHLVGMLLADGWLQAAGLPADTLGAAWP